ncbi:MAG: hypothetical protein IIC62_06220 [Proteobacteria bacterium]|nr:hypothetical protein [Pseudomonadota bacterium]
MFHNISCFRCGASLAAMSLPLSRQDECPECSVYLHVCRMCKNFDPTVPRQCLEDGAEDVTEKDRVNFCDWFSPDASAFDAVRKSQADSARQSLDALFDSGKGGEGSAASDTSSDSDDAEKLFQ